MPLCLLMVLAWIISSFQPTAHVRMSLGGSGSKNSDQRIQPRLTSRIAELTAARSDSWQLFEGQWRKIGALSYTAYEAKSLGHVLCLADIEILNISDGILAALTLQQRFAIEFWGKPEDFVWMKVRQVVPLTTSIRACPNASRTPSVFVFSLHTCNATEAAQSCDQDALRALLRQQVTAGAASSQVGAQMLEMPTLAMQFWSPIAVMISRGCWQDCSMPRPCRFIDKLEMSRLFPEIVQVHCGQNASWLQDADSGNMPAAHLTISSLRIISDNIRHLGAMLSMGIQGLTCSSAFSVVLAFVFVFV